MMPAYNLIKGLCNTPTDEDRSEQYLDTIKMQLTVRNQNIDSAPLFVEILKFNDRQI